MLQYMPILGTILLTAIILWIGISTYVGNRRQIRDALHRKHFVNDNRDAEVTSEFPACTCHPEDRPPECMRQYAASECVDLYRRQHPEIAAMWSDEGDPLPASMAHQPNIGGEGNPDYQGPHYEVDHDRFVPYDVIGDPFPGAAVHIVGNVAMTGPLEPAEGTKDDISDDNNSR
jgi:hypothetical protein